MGRGQTDRWAGRWVGGRAGRQAKNVSISKLLKFLSFSWVKLIVKCVLRCKYGFDYFLCKSLLFIINDNIG